jgi:hypothetical protein
MMDRTTTLRWHFSNLLKRALGGSLLLLFLLTGAALGNSPKVTVELHRERTSLEEPVTLMIRIEGSRETPEVIPEESSEVVLTPRGQSTSVQIINGVQSMHQDLYYAVFPQREGTLTIPPLELRFPSGARIRTEPLSLEVTPAPGGSSPGGRSSRGEAPQSLHPPRKASRKAFVTASLSKERVYAGEPVTYRFSFFRALPAGESRLTPPDFGSIPWEALEREVYHTEIDDTPYVVTEIPFLLSPVLPGEHSISPTTLDVILGEENPRQHAFSGGFPGGFPGGLFPSSLEDFFQFSPAQGRPYHLETEPLSLEVLPLPAWKEVPPFSGLVGSGDIRCLLHPREGKTGEPRKLTVLVRGKGNMQDLQPPELLFPGEIKVYEEPTEESLRPSVEGYEGIRAFSWSLIPLREGSWDLPPVQLALFDPEIGEYQVIEAPIPSFSAQGASLSEGMGTFDTPEPSPLPEEPPGEKKEEPRKIPLRDPEKKALGDLLPLPSPGFFLILFLLPPLLAGCGEGIRRFLRGRKTPRYRMIRRSRKALCEARRARNPKDMLAWLHKALTWGLFARLRREGELLTRNLLESLEESELASQEVEEATRFLTRLEKMLYGEGEKEESSQGGILEEPWGFSESKESLKSFERDLTNFVRRLWR